MHKNDKKKKTNQFPKINLKPYKKLTKLKLHTA